jgi:hypothetical protein
MTREEFLGLSACLTGFIPIDLEGTGLVDVYFAELKKIVGATIADELGSAFAAAAKTAAGDEARLEQLVHDTILVTPKLGPVAQSLIQMWYLGSWVQLPAAWRNQFGTSPDDTDRVVSAEAYKEGLVWPAIGSHPGGAKEPGFATWSFPPVALSDR